MLPNLQILKFQDCRNSHNPKSPNFKIFSIPNFLRYQILEILINQNSNFEIPKFIKKNIFFNSQIKFLNFWIQKSRFFSFSNFQTPKFPGCKHLKFPKFFFQIPWFKKKLKSKILVKYSQFLRFLNKENSSRILNNQNSYFQIPRFQKFIFFLILKFSNWQSPRFWKFLNFQI